MDASQKCFHNEDILEVLLTFMDLPSTLALASCHPLTVRILQQQHQWQNLINRAKLNEQTWLSTKISAMQKRVFFLCKTLKMMEKSLIVPFLDRLLDHIFVSFPPTRDTNGSKDSISIKLKSFEQGQELKISPVGFMLVALVEANMGLRHILTQVKVKSRMKYKAWYPLDRALSSHAKLQGVQVMSLDMEYLKLDKNYLLFLLEVKQWKVCHLNLCGLVDGFSWGRLAKALDKGGEVECVIVSQHTLMSGGREGDVQRVWEASTGYWFVKCSGEKLVIGREDGWDAIMDICKGRRRM